MMEKITITRALSSLKTLQGKIDKATPNAEFCTTKVGGKVSKDIKAKENFQKINDLIDYRDAI